MELTRVGPGTAMGDLMRCYWIPAALSSEARARRPAAAAHAARREADRVPRQRRPGRRDGPSLSAPLRFPVSRPQRGRRVALRLSRLEVRRGRQLHRHAERAAGPGLQAQGQGQGLSRPRAGRRGLGLHGPAGGAAAAGVRGPRPSRGRDPRGLRDARVQLAAGAGGRDRHLAFRLSPRRPCRGRRSGGGRAAAQHGDQPPSAVPSRRRRVGHAICGLPRVRAGPDVLALRQLPVSVLDAGAQRRVRQPHARARLGAARRRAHHVRVFLVAARQARR